MYNKKKIQTLVWKYCLNYINNSLNKRKSIRNLEIGPSQEPCHGFESVDIVWKPKLDYVLDASDRTFFPDETFNILFLSHILEHIPWYKINSSLTEYRRILKPGGKIEIWLPDCNKLCKLFIDIDNGIDRKEWKDEWRKEIINNNPYHWIAGKILYGMNPNYPSWHKSLHSYNSLSMALNECGFINIRQLDNTEYRGAANHGWINLGIIAQKPEV